MSVDAAKAMRLGATECINPTEFAKPIQSVIVEKTDGGVVSSWRSVRLRAYITPSGLLI